MLFRSGIVRAVIPIVMVCIMAYYVATEVGQDPLRTLGGLALMALLLVGCVMIMARLREGGATRAAARSSSGGE